MQPFKFSRAVGRPLVERPTAPCLRVSYNTLMDILKIRQDFPMLQTTPLVYLDSSATSLKPQSVIDKEIEYYTKYSANVHRGIYKIAEKATEEYEATRNEVANFIHAEPSEVIFTRGTTEAINLVASTLGEHIVNEGDEIAGTLMEHHSNFVPWQQLALRKNAQWKVWEFDQDGLFNLETLSKVITDKTKLFSFTAVSNTFGTINPVKQIVEKARLINPNIIVIIDAAQAAPHTGINVHEWNADFVAFSAHKMLGPSGVGVLWGKKEHLEQMSPYQFGGEMVLDVNVDFTEFKQIPHKFEAGTPNIAGVIAFKAAIEYLQQLNLNEIHEHEMKLRIYATEQLRKEFGENIRLLGENKPEERCGILSFAFEKYHSHDVAQILDESNIAVRAGHHCTMPLHKKLNIDSTTRASFYIYTTEAEVDALVEGVKKVISIFK